MIIRALASGDGPVFRQIRLEALRTDPTSFAAATSDYDESTDWERILSRRTAFVAFDEDTPVGLASLVGFEMSRMAHRGTITNVYVAPRMRGRGIADRLMDAVEAEARLRRIVQLELAVNAERHAALRFYERRGYVGVGRIPRGFRHGQRFHDEILMCRVVDMSSERA